MRATLIEVIDRLDEVDCSDRFAPPCIYAVGGPHARPDAPSLVCPTDEEGSLKCPEDSTLSYVLMVKQAQACIRVWSAWRGGRTPTRQDKFAAVMYYSQHDAWLPLQGHG